MNLRHAKDLVREVEHLRFAKPYDEDAFQDKLTELLAVIKSMV